MSNVDMIESEPLYNLEKRDKKDLDRGSTPAASSNVQSRQKEEEFQKVKHIIYHDVTARDLIRQYLGLLIQNNSQRNDLSVGMYVDSASGEERQVGGEAIALVLVSSSSFNESCGDDKDALQENLKCPISCGIMQETVKCSDGKTYDRSWIEKWAKINLTAPETREPLAFEEAASGKKLQWSHNVRLREVIEKFKKEKLAILECLKRNAEGEDEKRILRNRFGVKSNSSDSKENTEGKHINSAKEFLEWVVGESSMGLACLTGPPASGKTVTIQQIVYAAAQNFCTHMGEVPDVVSKQKMPLFPDVESKQKMPLFPLFMQAAVLSMLVHNSREDVTTLRQLVDLFLDHGVVQEIFSTGVKGLILDLLDLNNVLICIDGLDEAAQHQALVEGSIEHAVREAAEKGRRVHVLISTREHSYVHSRACLRRRESAAAG